MKIATLISFALLVVSAKAAAYPSYQTACTISLIGSETSPLEDTKISDALPAEASPRVSFDLGGTTLVSYVSSVVLDESTHETEPQLSVELFRSSEGPIVGQINLAGASGLKDLSVGQSVKVFSRNFLHIVYKMREFSRIDYTCQLTRFQ